MLVWFSSRCYTRHHKEPRSSHARVSPPAMAAPTSPSTPNLHGLPPIPPSPTHSFASTAFPAASLNLPPPPAPLLPKNFLSRSDVATSIAAYEGLLDSAKVYRKAMAAVAAAASSFGAALESCAKCMVSSEQLCSNFRERRPRC